jgi:hypothetical protein
MAKEPGMSYSGPVGMRRGNGALILVVLIALAIVLYLMFGMNTGGSGGSTGKGSGSTYMGQVGETRRQGKAAAAEISTQQLSILIAQYRNENNRLPKSPADMGDDRGAFRDPWGNEMTFAFEEQRGKTMVTYRSKGPDGEAGTEDDVSRPDALPF